MDNRRTSSIKVKWLLMLLLSLTQLGSVTAHAQTEPVVINLPLLLNDRSPAAGTAQAAPEDSTGNQDLSPSNSEQPEQVPGRRIYLPSVTAGSEQTDEDTSPATGLPEGYALIEGDVLVPEQFLRDDEAQVSGVWETKFWPDGNVLFEFDANVVPISRTLTLTAMSRWEAVAAVDFIQCPNNNCMWPLHFIHVQHHSKSNSSPVGRQGGIIQSNEQDLNIHAWFESTIVHELGHALGLWHEQSRDDRFDYVTILADNILDDEYHNFKIRRNIFKDNMYPKPAYGLPGEQAYDFGSIMHYWQYAFSKCTPQDVADGKCSTALRTIEVKPRYAAWQSRIGNASRMSSLDALTMSFLYPRPKWRFVDKWVVELPYPGFFENGSFVRPYKQLKTGVNNTPNGGTLWVQPGSYSGVGTYNKPMTIRAPLGNVTLTK